jgi:hypothetical protein
MEREQVMNFLTGLPVEQLVSLLGSVFERTFPAPEERSYSRNHFFLGVADSIRESDDGEPERWGEWSIAAVAYVNAAEYPAGWGLGPDYGLCQSGTCSVCETKSVSNNKAGLCAVCGTPVYMT